MIDFYKPDFGTDANSPFARDSNGHLIRKSFWLDMSDKSVILLMTVGIGSHLTNDQKINHLNNINRSHLTEDICIQEILPPLD